MRQFGQLLRDRVNQAQSAEQGIKAIVAANIEWISENPAWASYCFHHRGAVKHGSAAETFSADNKAFHQFYKHGLCHTYYQAKLSYCHPVNVCISYWRNP